MILFPHDRAITSRVRLRDIYEGHNFEDLKEFICKNGPLLEGPSQEQNNNTKIQQHNHTKI
jgi:hypothetical protein